MKTITSLKFIIAVMVVASFMLLIKGCKKVDNTPSFKDAEAAKAAAIKAIKDQYGNVSTGVVFNVNKTADDYFYKDASGSMVNLYGSSATSASSRGEINRPAPCMANCNTTSNPADLRIIYTLDYVQRFYECENFNKSTISVKWTVSVPFNLGYTIGNIPPLTYGNVQIKNAGGIVIQTFQATNNQVTETLIGADPSCPTWNNLWEVTYTFTQVANGFFAAGNTLAASVSLENDCALVGNVVQSGFVSAPTFSQNAYLPCNRIDFVFIAPAGGTAAYWQATSMEGASLTCSFPSGWTYVDKHQLEYRQINTTSDKWADQTSPVYWGVPYGTSITSPTVGISGNASIANLINMVNVNGNWLVRYRNVKNGTCDVILNTSGSNNASPDPQAGADWGNPALWFSKKW